MSAGVFLDRLARLMGSNPPAADDEPMISRLRQIGVAPGAPFAFDRLPSRSQGRNRERHCRRPGPTRSDREGCLGGGARRTAGGSSASLGRYGTDYATRALVAILGLGSNLAEDAVYPITRVDADGAKLTGANRYRLHFDAGDLPPVHAFWSVTMYSTQQFLVKNPIGRYALGDRNPLQFNADGSLISTCRTPTPDPTSARTGFPRHRTASAWSCASTPPRRPCSTEAGRRPRSSAPDGRSPGQPWPSWPASP